MSAPTVSTRLAQIAEQSKREPARVFTTLVHHLDEDFLTEALHQLRKDAAAGIDQMTVAEYSQNLKENISALHQRLVNRTYRAQPAKRVWIPKADGSQRPLAILVLEDKIVQRAVVMLLEAVYEPHFHAFSYGFRRQHSAHGALSYLRDQCLKLGINWIIDADIAKFLDPCSYYTFAAEGWLKSCAWLSKTRMRKPFCLPRLTWTTESSPRLTRCMIVWRDTPRMRMACGIAT